MDSDIAAGTFMNNLRSAYNLPEDLPDEDLYRMIAVRYELELRGIDGMPLDNYVLASDVTPEQLAAITELGIPGVTVQISTVREYKTTQAAHLLGTTGKMTRDEYNGKYKDLGYALNAMVGKDGVELAFESTSTAPTAFWRPPSPPPAKLSTSTIWSPPSPAATWSCPST